jgi:hypothetical protein
MALIGLNGGLIGKQRSAFTVIAPGLWTANEQVMLKRAGLWLPASDPDAAAYIAAVEAADGQLLEDGVKSAINTFVVGCKADGIWTALKASCILAGARTLTGALVPLVGTAPTNNNFVSGDYNRETGLIGNGTSKYIDTNRLTTADGQNNAHIAVWQSSAAALAINGYATSIGAVNTVGSTSATDIAEGFGTAGTEKYYRCRDTGGSVTKSTSNQNGFQGVTRSSSASVTYRVNNANVSRSITSIAVTGSSEYAVFASNTEGVINSYSNARLAFYSIGESLDLALLDTRVTRSSTPLLQPFRSSVDLPQRRITPWHR